MTKMQYFEFVMDILVTCIAIYTGYWIGAILYIAFSTYFNMSGLGKVLHNQLKKFKQKLEKQNG